MPRHPGPLKEIGFHNPRLVQVGVEVMDLVTLRQRAGAALVLPERVDFYLLLLVHAGRARHRVDFVEYTLAPGHALFVRPGQVQQWLADASLRASLVLVSPEALAPSVAQAPADMKLLALDAWPAVMRPDAALFRQARADVARLAADIASFAGEAIDAAVIRHGLLALLLRLARAGAATGGTGDAAPETGIYRLFTRTLEQQFDRRPSVRDLAGQLGYSESTLTRACLAAAGRTAKDVVDQRTALEAKRLLVHSTAGVAQIGHRLGFTEATNFIKFFRRVVGMTPLAFRTTVVAER